MRSSLLKALTIAFFCSLRYILIVTAALALAGTREAAAEQVYRVGITAFRDKAVTLREWQATMDYLSAKIPDSRFIPLPMTLPELQTGLRRKELDFVLTNPQHYIILKTAFGVSRVATLVKRENGKEVNRFGGVIFTRADRLDITRLEDLQGKRIASVDRTSFAAFLLQYDLLHARGLDLDTASQIHFLGFPQDLSVEAVLGGQADAGFVRTGVLEAMAQEGRITLEQLRVLGAARHPGFPFLVSTELFPEWPLAAAPQVPIEITNQVVASLLLMPPDSPAARSARYYRWSTPLEYEDVEALMRRHHIYPYDRPERISPSEFVRQYMLPILLGLFLAVTGLAVLYLRTRQLNIALKASRQRLSALAHRDPLTGLPNRHLLDDRLALALAQARRHHSRLAICLADLDGFKPINDNLGHPAGDQVLQDIARQLEGTLREGDTVARWGGDEFVLLINGFADGTQLDEILKRVLEAIAASTAPGFPYPVSASIGASLFPSDADTAQLLFKHADEAMYEAKKGGGKRHVIYRRPAPPPVGARLPLAPAPAPRDA